MSLNRKQRRFAQEYVIDLNATQSAIRAGYSKRSAYSQGQRLLKHAEVQAEIQQKRNEIAAKNDITIERVLQELAKIAYFNPQKMYDSNNNLLTIPEMPADVAAAIGGVKVLRDGTIEYKFIDKKGANDSLMKHLGGFEKDNEQRRAKIDGLEIEFVKSKGDEG